ncbi:MAG: hypothetical protein RIT81_24700 [Deltaproteobacteria bacterium]
MKRSRHPLLTLACAAALGSTACGELIVADFEDPLFVVGSDPQNGLPGSPAGDLLVTSGFVTVEPDSGTGMGKHIFLNSTATTEATAEFIPASGPQGNNLKLSFEAYMEDPGSAWIDVWADDGSGTPLQLSILYISKNSMGEYSIGGCVPAPPSSPSGNCYSIVFVNEDPNPNAPVMFHIRYDRTYDRVFASYASDTPNAPDVIAQGEQELYVDFNRIESVVFRGCSAGDPNTGCGGGSGDLRLGKVQLVHWTEQQQYYAAETARRYGFIPASTHPDGRTSLDDEVTMFHRALEATAATLNRYLDPATVAIVQYLQR